MKSKATELLDPLIESYELNRDVLKIAHRVIDAADNRHLNVTGFLGLTKEQGLLEVQVMRSRLEESTVVALWTAFERYVVDWVEAGSHRITSITPPSLASRLVLGLRPPVERWPFDDVLDLFKPWIDTALLGHAKQVKDYRDWVAHRNPKRARPATTDPATARSVLGDVIDGIEALIGVAA